MPDYKKMYQIMCVAASRAIDEPPGMARCTLQAALDEAEEVYIRTCGSAPEERGDEAVVIPLSHIGDQS